MDGMQGPVGISRKLVAVRLSVAMHRAVRELVSQECKAGRHMTVTEVYEAALGAYLMAAGRKYSERIL